MLSRLPRNAEGLQVVALALAPGAGIPTEDKAFFECGVGGWRTQTFVVRLERGGW